MSTVQALRKPPPRSPEREALAEAIQRHNLATRTLAANVSAQGTTFDAIIAARRTVERATKIVEEAKENAAAHLTAAAMGTDGIAPMSVKDARAKLQDAGDALDAAVSANEQLKAQHAAAANELRWAVDARDKAVRGVLRVDGAALVDATLREAAALQEQLGAKRVLLSFLRTASFGWAERELTKPIAEFLAAPAYPLEFNGTTDEHPALPPWRAAVAALATDPDSPLPV